MVCVAARVSVPSIFTSCARCKVTAPGLPGTVKQTRGPRAMCSPGLSACTEIRAGTVARETSRSPAAQRKRDM